jgi:tape measure domain-containing protein
MERGGGNFVTDILVRLLADNSQFMDRMRAAQHATYDSVRAIKALNVTAGGDLNKLLNSTLRNTIGFATRTFSAVASDALDAIAFEENNQMALAALAEYRMKQEAITKLATERVQVGTKVLTIEDQLAALDRRRMAEADKANSATLDQINWLNDIKRLQIDIQQYENGITKAREKLADTTKNLTGTERERLTLQIKDYQEKINDITTYQIPKAQEKLAKSGYQPFQANENQVDWDAMAAQIMAGGDKVVGIFADQAQGLTAKNIAEIKKKADEESRATMEVLSTMAIRSPFSRKEIVEGYGTLIRMGGITFEQGKEMMQQIVDIQSVTGKGQKGIQAMTLGIGKILAIGRINGDTMNQLVKTAGIPVWEILAKSTGKTVAELQKMMRANKLSAEIVMPALQDYMRDFAGKAAEEAGTFVGLVNSIQDIKDSVLVDFFQPIGEAFKRPFQSLIDFLTVGPFREKIREAGLYIGETLTKAIDVIYEKFNKFKNIGEGQNPLVRILMIIRDIAKEFNVDTGGITRFINVMDGVINWVMQNQKTVNEFADTIKNLFLTLVAVTSIASVLGKIQMFITGFLASPIGILVLAIAGLYLAWQYNFGGIADWIDANQEKVQNFLLNLFTETSKLINLLNNSNINIDIFLEKLGQYGLVGKDFETGTEKIRQGLKNLMQAREAAKESTSLVDPKADEAMLRGTIGIEGILQGVFSSFLNPDNILKSIKNFITDLASLIDPYKNPGLAQDFAGIGYSIGAGFRYAIGWLLNIIGGTILSADTLSKVFISIGNAIYTILSGLVGLIAGLFTVGPQLDEGEAVSKSFAGMIIDLIVRGLGALVGMLALALSSSIASILNSVILFFTALFSPSSTKKVETEVKTSDYNRSLAQFLEATFVKPFSEAFKSDKLEEYLNYIKKAISYIFAGINSFFATKAYEFQVATYDSVKPVLDVMSDMGSAMKTAALKLIGKNDEEIRKEIEKDKNEDIVLNWYKEWPEKAKKARDDAIKKFNDMAPPVAPNAFSIPLPPEQPVNQIPIPYQFRPEFGPGWPNPSMRADQGPIVNYVGEVRRVAEESIQPVNLPISLKNEDVEQAIKTVKNQIERDRFPFPVDIVLLPETGDDLMGGAGKQGFYTEDAALKIMQMMNLDTLGPDVSLAIFEDIKSGVNDGVKKASDQIYKNKTNDSIPGYAEIGLVQGEAISAGLVSGLKTSETAIVDLNRSVIQVSNQSLPELAKSVDTWRLDMTTRVSPQVEAVRTSVIDPLAKSFDAVGAAIERVSEKLAILQIKFSDIKIPDQLTANSPTPFELGLRGIAKATDDLNGKPIPRLFSDNVSAATESNRMKAVISGSSINNKQNINVVVKVGDKEVASAVATSVAGEVKKMIYRDSLRG